MQFPGYRILIFARAPVPGTCKTRLVPALGEWGAARLSGALTLHLLAMLDEARVAPAILCCTPDCGHPLFQRRGEEKWVQRGNDLGERMLDAVGRALEEAGRVLLLGTDCPVLLAGYLEKAFRALERSDVVIGPAEDGGYVLLGLKKLDASLFRGIAWGTSAVLDQTLERVAELEWRYELLETLWDVDRPEDLMRLRRDFPAIFSG